MHQQQFSPEIISAAEPLVRFITKKLSYDEMDTPGQYTSEIDRATAKRAVEAAAWAINLMPETADILDESPALRLEVLRLLDLENEFGETMNPTLMDQTRLEFAASIRENAKLYSALLVIAPNFAERVDYLYSRRQVTN